MSTCGPGHLPVGLSKGIPELFFVATAIKACYGILPSWKRSSEQTRVAGGPPAKTPRLQMQSMTSLSGEPRCETVDEEYRRAYCELRNKALSDIKSMVREHVENHSTSSSSYDFMNIYGMCSFDPPNVARVSHQNDQPLRCKFTKITCPEDNSNSNSHRLISVSGILNPLICARLEQGELDLSYCRESDYDRAMEEFVRLDSRNKMRVPRVSNGQLGSTIGSMENRFIFTVREDLHTLGCAYRQMVVLVELLHLHIIHFIQS